MNMRPIQFLIFVIFFLASSTLASAAGIAVRIVNETGYDIGIADVFANDKRGRDARQGDCPKAGTVLDRVRPDDDKRCELRGTPKKQRSIEVDLRCRCENFTAQGYIADGCDESSSITVVFPRNRGWFGRTHLKNNNHIYTLKIKESDC